MWGRSPDLRRASTPGSLGIGNLQGPDLEVRRSGLAFS